MAGTTGLETATYAVTVHKLRMYLNAVESKELQRRIAVKSESFLSFLHHAAQERRALHVVERRGYDTKYVTEQRAVFVMRYQRSSGRSIKMDLNMGKRKMKAEMYEELDRDGDEMALIKAACDATEITINGKVFEPDGPVRSDDLADLLNSSLDLVGNMARFKFDDRSFLEVTVVSKSGKGRNQAYVVWGMEEPTRGTHI